MVDVNLQVDLGGDSVEEDLVICMADSQHRFTVKPV